jgi:hypothetical protein
MNHLFSVANIAFYVPIVVYLLSLLLQQFTNTMWWYLRVWDPISDFSMNYAFYGLPFIALAFVFSTPYKNLFTRVVKVIIGVCFVIFICFHIFLLTRLGTPLPDDLGASIAGFLLFMIVGPIFFIGSLWLSLTNLTKHS